MSRVRFWWYFPLFVVADVPRLCHQCVSQTGRGRWGLGDGLGDLVEIHPEEDG